MRFRPCIDLHQGRVKQIVGSTFSDESPDAVATNYVSPRPASHFAEMYRRDGLRGGHVIMLGPGNDEAAREALAAFPGGLQVGGGIGAANARQWLDAGASAVIVTSYVFRGGKVSRERIDELRRLVGRDRLVLDLSCRRRADRYYVVTDRWQKFTDMEISEKNLALLGESCAEFLVHAADVEGRCAGVAGDLVRDLGRWSPVPTTYAGGIGGPADLELLFELGRGRLDFTVGSALDIFGGSGLTYAELLDYRSGRRG